MIINGHFTTNRSDSHAYFLYNMFICYYKYRSKCRPVIQIRTITHTHTHTHTQYYQYNVCS